ncbi:MAG: histone deacetylase [Gammaproteobacteria bacterium]|jgi:acetoin utilization deacetylase AcuC-like enzyme|nr:histone deacetylase [Chromatiales bacterium]MCP4926286.1 histone deacetylase [Gammaproteobacteria bacterium]MDP6149832.1 histone deacetylase [Gammaproteobacteria bacterium]MDP7270684.1 histone deacetylase [Gammaproteobacteria bacterium]MDP7419919.1 histone deacetylase [Gammaproteobacteria bacterium]
MSHQTGFAFSELTLNYRSAPGHPESPERLQKLLDRATATGILQDTVDVSAYHDTKPFLANIHSEEHIQSICSEQNNARQAALEALGLALGSVRDVCSGNINNAFCAVRPPGHHAHNNGANHDALGAGEGFCFFNNIAIAARYAQSLPAIARVLIVDWDYHHGNGTEWAFYRDPSVYFFSTHEWQAYPGTGSPERLGAGPGAGYNLNVPLAAGAGDEEVLRAFAEHAVAAADNFNPDLILISAGFDSRVDDPLGTFKITDTGFSRLTKLLMELADHHCEGRLVSFLEGGYNEEGLALAACAHLETLKSGL